MSAVEKDFYVHAGRVLGRLKNGHNTMSVRREALSIIQSGILTPDNILHRSLLNGVEKGWRSEGPSEGPIDDSILDNNPFHNLL